MFKKEPTKSNKNIETIIGPSVKVDGDFHGDGDVIVEGIVTGNLKTKNDLKVMEGAKIQAEIEAKNAFVAGEILGNITVKENIDLTASAKVKGDLTANLISIERGAIVNGKLTMQASQPGLPSKASAENKEE
ncbi:polymer-forming cytoskeletal protein [Patescibacteria group bacterium]|nr:polymer-forming cytoskeletal protein [Patescibacteria group bacterium]